MQQRLNTAEADEQLPKQLHHKRPCDQTAQQMMSGSKDRPEGHSGRA